MGHSLMAFRDYRYHDHTRFPETADRKDLDCPDCDETVIISICGIFSPTAPPWLMAISIHGFTACTAKPVFWADGIDNLQRQRNPCPSRFQTDLIRRFLYLVSSSPIQNGIFSYRNDFFFSPLIFYGNLCRTRLRK